MNEKDLADCIRSALQSNEAMLVIAKDCVAIIAESTAQLNNLLNVLQQQVARGDDADWWKHPKLQ